jgi:uncharacterized damage-inducible protein DinB
VIAYDKQFLRHLFDYMIWADRAGFEAACALPEAEYYRQREFSFGAIHNLLVHQMSAQKTWLSRWKGTPVLGRIDNHIEHPTRQLLAERWPPVHQGLLEFLDQQTDEALNTPMTVQRTDGEYLTAPLGGMMMHVIDHGSYHRGQLASMIKQAGVAKPPYSPYFYFAIQNASRPT